MINRIIITILFFSFVTNYSFSQNDTSDRKTDFGIGINLLSRLGFGFEDYDDISGYFIFLPVQFNNHYRIEPSFQFSLTKKDNYFATGIGFFRLKRFDKLQYYYGLRTTYWNIRLIEISPTIGCDFYLSDRFSIGAEAQLRSFLWKSEILGVMTDANFIVRYYF